MVGAMIVCALYIFGFVIVWFLVIKLHVPMVCVIENVFYALSTKMPSSQINFNSLCYCKVSYFILIVTICKYDYSPDHNTMVRKLSIVCVYKLLANFNNLS